MSSPFFGNPPSGGDGGQDQKPFTFSRPSTPAAGTTAGSGASGQTPASAPRTPLFPPRDGADNARPSGVQAGPQPGVRPAAGSEGAAPRAPLFPRREPAAPGSPLFAPKAGTDKAPPAPRAPLFPPRAPAAPGAGTSLFAPRQETARPSAESSLFGNRPARGAEGAAPAFGSRPAAPSRPLFGAAPAAPARPSAFSSGAGSRETRISDEEFVQMRDFLYQQSGIFIAENRKYLVENRLASRLRELGLRSFGEYYKYLRYDANRAEEMNKLFESMTTNETSFFRNQPQLDVFRDKVLLKLLNELRAKGQKKLHIWSAGCSSGEEPYTLAIILHEVLKQEISSWDIKITANDLSLAVLASARRGLYNDYAIRTTPPDMLARYFTREGSLYRIDPKLQKLISFGQINLSDKAQLQKVERSHIVFCRNVIIYFDDDMKRNVINAFYDNLLPGGYLIIGHSESLHNISRAFKPEHYTGSIVYYKQN